MAMASWPRRRPRQESDRGGWEGGRGQDRAGQGHEGESVWVKLRQGRWGEAVRVKGGEEAEKLHMSFGLSTL